jgi:hypothetical protein
VCGVEILGVMIKIYVMSDIHGIKEKICDLKWYYMNFTLRVAYSVT